MMLLGILYCRSNRRQRAEKLYELVDSEKSNKIEGKSKFLRAYLPKMADISHNLMFKLYERHRDQTPDEKGQNLLQPEVDIKPFLPSCEDMDYDLKV